MTASVPQAHRLVHLLDDRNPPVPAGRPVYTVCGLVVPPLEPGRAHAPNFETTRRPDAATCPECTGSRAYTWFRVVAINPDDIQGDVARTPEEAWHSFFNGLERSVTYVVIRATTRRAAAEARPRIPFLGCLWYPLGPWLQGRLLGRIGRGRWQLLR